MEKFAVLRIYTSTKNMVSTNQWHIYAKWHPWQSLNVRSF